MGAYNTITFAYRPPEGEPVEICVQFKYGDTRQLDYRVGDRLRWGGNDIGDKAAKKVVVDACLDDDVPRPDIPDDFVLFIENGVLQKVEPNRGFFDFVNSEETYIILEK